jgi:hypothetical protein
MTVEQFAHHVSPHKNDFATWIEVLNGPGGVTKIMRSSKTKEEMYRGLLRKRAEYFERERVAQLPKKIIPERIVQPVPVPAAPIQQPELPKKKQELFSPSPDVPESIPIMDDVQFASLRDEYAKRNERMLDRFETIASRLKASLEDPMPQDLTKRAEELKEHYEELRVRISDLRKQGKDMLMPSLELRRIPPKIAWAKAVRERGAFEEVDKMLDAVRAEIDEVLHGSELDVKKEVLAIAGQAKNREESL